MAQYLTDGTASWVGGMDTSRDPADIAQIQYSNAANVIIPTSMGGIKTRFGFHCCSLNFENKETKEIYRNGNIQAEGYFKSSGRMYLIAVVDGWVLKFTPTSRIAFDVSIVNHRDRNANSISCAWVITIPNGCIVNNGFDHPLYVTEIAARRLRPSKGEMGIGQMGVYLQNRLFMVDQSGTRILVSDFMQPTMFTLEGTNIFGFMCPDASEKITAIGKQKSIIGTVEGGNLIWSSDKDIYSVDVRGTRSEWANLGSRVGKVSETVPGFSAVSSYSFESFNTNLYFRNAQHGLVDLKQSEYQFVNTDASHNQSIEASLYFDNDTDWMLAKCYTRSCNKRLYTTVAPEKNEAGFVYWNGFISMHPAAVYVNQGQIPRRFESVFTGVRPWCLTSVSNEYGKDSLWIHSYDTDKINRLYMMDESTNYDTNEQGNIVEISGFIETRAYTHESALSFKKIHRRFYKLNSFDRSVKIKLFSRQNSDGEWMEMWNEEHKVCRISINNGVFNPVASKPQNRLMVNVSNEKNSPCSKGDAFMSMQYRFEFKGPLNLSAFVTIATIDNAETIVYQQEEDCNIVSYEIRPTYNYFINEP